MAFEKYKPWGLFSEFYGMLVGYNLGVWQYRGGGGDWKEEG